MSIQIICPGCRKRFEVSDKYAGKKGPCPKCKTEIRIPEKSEEIVVHEPDSFGPKGSKGRATLKPIFREETKVSPLIWTIIGGGILTVLVVALVLRSNYQGEDQEVPLLILTLGAIVLAPPIALGGYSFLRDDELEPYRDMPLYIRSAICGILYALIWGILALMIGYLFPEDPVLTTPALTFVVPAMIAAGAFCANVCLDLTFGSGIFHYGLYLLVTVLLRLMLGLTAL